MKYHIEKNTVQETLVIPLFGRLVCSERFPDLFSDPEAKRICDSLDYDFADKRRKMESAAGLFGALEVAQRQYDLRCEVEDYLKSHPKAAVVNLGCGLDDTIAKVDNGQCKGYNIDLPGVINVRNDLLPAGERETNLACDLNDFSGWTKLMRRMVQFSSLPACSIIPKPRMSGNCCRLWLNISRAAYWPSIPATSAAQS